VVRENVLDVGDIRRLRDFIEPMSYHRPKSRQ